MTDPRNAKEQQGHQPTPEATLEERLTLERQVFHLKTLFETSRILTMPATPKELLANVLPVAMGPLGLTFGFAVLSHSQGLETASVGLAPKARTLCRDTGTNLVAKVFPADGSGPASDTPTILTGSHLSHDPILPADTAAVIAIPVDQHSNAVLGFGPKISAEPLDDKELELLQGIATILTATLKKTCAERRVQDLNGLLIDRNEHLKEALDQAQQAQDELSRRAFQLQALYETTLELSGINAPHAILDAFILALMGSLSFSSGWIGLYGPGDTTWDVTYRGPAPDDRDKLASPIGREAVLQRFVELKDQMPHAHHSALLEGDALSRLPVQADVGLLFSLDHGWRGAIGLSGPISDAPMSDERKHLLQSLTGTFIATLGNARQMRMVQDLNSDLAARNVELQTTLDELTSAQQEIGVLTETKERIVGLVSGEVARVQRASWLDVCLIVLAGVVLGVLFNFSSPEGINILPASLMEPPPAMVDVREATRMVHEQEAIIIDARPADFYKQGHIKGAVNLPKDLFSFVYSMKLADLDPATPLIIYGRTISRHYDADVARELEMLGHESIVVIDGGLDAWTDAGNGVAK